MGFSEKHKDLSALREYMWLLVTDFLKNLTELPEIELVREHAEPRLSDISAERLLNAVPFALGAEYINKNGLRIYLKSLRKYLHRR